MTLRAKWRWSAVAVGVIVGAGLVLRFVQTSDLWLDEALSVNVARLPLSDLRAALRHDGAPPLYYVLLHFWMQLFGEGDVAVRALSGVFSLATFPALYFAGRRVGGRRVAWLTVILFAVSPYAIRFAGETRMYALVMFLVAWGFLALVRALERPSLGRLALVAVSVTALLYSHNWSIYLIATTGAVVVIRAIWGVTPEARRAGWSALTAVAAGGVLYLPWVPTLRYQAGHTGTPWGDPILPWAGLSRTVQGLAGIGIPIHAEAEVLGYVLVVFGVFGVLGAAVDGRHIDLDLRTRPAVRWIAAVSIGTLGLGLCASYAAGTAFDPRYTAVVVPLLMLLLAAGLAVFADDRVRYCVVGLVVVLGLAGGVRTSLDNRTQADEVASVIRAEAEPGDLVLYCPDQLGPSVHRLLGDDLGVKEATFPALQKPDRVNWVNYRDRIAATDVDAFIRKVLDRADGHTIWYVDSPGYRSFDDWCERLDVALSASRPVRFTRVAPNRDEYFEYTGLVQYGGP